ncbi:MAG TPA: DUF1549 domain-containing protein [Pirellulaceae bacterium]|jgi:hypothetical protein|nr:DUF1549 domain-containing protein [Pirellulaceae bacterium]
MRNPFAGRALALCCLFPACVSYAGELPPAAEVARRFDASLRQELDLAPDDLAPPADDAMLMRRLWLDTLGYPPSREEAEAMNAAGNLDVAAVVPGLLGRRDFSENWARYWLETLRERAPLARSLPYDKAALDFFKRELEARRSWATIARSVITADMNDRSRFVMHDVARPGVAATEVSRIFLGISIECAECHDHPTDSWKQEQFREFAAYFDRTYIDDYAIAKRREEVDSEQSLEGVTPRFFLDGSSIGPNRSDGYRRADISRRVASPSNPWFARAFVNRICGELLGQGFYGLPDDIGPGRDCLAPKSLEILAEDFAASECDIRRLFEIVLLTETYRLAGRSLADDAARPFACNRIQPLRGDQFFESMIRALGMHDAADIEGWVDDRMSKKKQLPPRAIVNNVFGFGPSEAREDVRRGIPQAIALMNSGLIEYAINDPANAKGPGSLIRRIGDDRELLDAIYLHMLSRRATHEERLLATEQLFVAPTRAEAFADVTWALINSAEFSHRP